MTNITQAPSPPEFPKEDKMNKSTKITALYERLSVEDGVTDSESNSIQTQKLILEEYAKAHGLTNIRHYTDDGISGLRFDDRPGYVQMMEDIESGKVAVCCIKDISRLGRDHIRVGLCMEIMRQNGVRLIGVTDGIDTAKGEDDFTPFRAIMHEFYAKDCSKKIKSAFKAKGMSGKPLASLPPYGYERHPDDKNAWVIDLVAAPVVKRIFQLAMDGKGIYQICCILTEDKIPVPGHYLGTEKGEARWTNRRPVADPYAWHINTVERILTRREYCGDLVNFKTSKHFKDKHSTYNDESQWAIFENNHEAIIDRTTFENVQRIYKNIKRKRAGKTGHLHPLAGLCYCSDCNGKLYIYRANWNPEKYYARCENYRRKFEKIQRSRYVHCDSTHHICTDHLLELVHHTIKTIADYAKIDRAAFEKTVKDLLTTQQTDEIKAGRKRLAVCRNRHIELEQLLNKIYEDYALNKLPEKRYESLMQTYSTEQESLEKEIEELLAAVAKYEDDSGRAERFTKLVDRYINFEELTHAMIHDFIEKIIVHEREIPGAKATHQQVDIHLNFIGEFDPAIVEYKISPEEQAELDRIASQRERNRRNYLKRKEKGYYQQAPKAIAQ